MAFRVLKPKARGVHFAAPVTVSVTTSKDGPDAGKLRIKPSQIGFRLKAESTGRLRVGLAAWGGVPKVLAPVAADARPDTIGKVLTITLPWAQGAAKAA